MSTPVNSAAPRAASLLDLTGGSPPARVLSNGVYSVVVSGEGTGGAWWGRFALTAFGGDGIEDPDGLFVYVRDLDSGQFWSVGRRPVSTGPKDERCDARWFPGKLEISRDRDGVSTRLEIAVAPEHAAEIRRVTVTNRSSVPREIELTTFAEVVLHDPRAHASHPGFSKLFLQTEWVPERRAVLVRRRPRGEGEQFPWLAHALLERDPSFETSRDRFVGRGGSRAAPLALTTRDALSETQGNVLDPVVALRDHFTLAPGQSATATFVLAVAAERSAALDLCASFAAPGAVDAAFEGAGRRELERGREMGLSEGEAEYLQSLAAAMLYRDPALRAPAGTLARATGSAADLPRLGVRRGSALAVLHAERTNGRRMEEEFLRAVRYWRALGVDVSAVVLGEGAPPKGAAVSDVRFLARSALSARDVDVLDALAHLVVADTWPDLGAPADAPTDSPQGAAAPVGAPSSAPEVESRPPTLEHFNGFGGFAESGREYVIPLPCRGGRLVRRPPRPWVNVVANERFGFLISETGAGNTWSGNSREHRLTPWLNDALLDPHGEAFYVRDEAGARFWSLFPGPAPADGDYELRHGLGYTTCRHRAGEIETETTTFVPREDPVRVTLVKVTNRGASARRLSLCAYARLVLGVAPEDDGRNVVTAGDAASGRLLARNRLVEEFAGGVTFAFADSSAEIRARSFTADRGAFLGPGGTAAEPAALRRDVPLDGRTGAGLDPCFAQQLEIEVPPGGSAEVTFLLGEGGDEAHVRKLIARYAAPASARGALADAIRRWSHDLAGPRIETPSSALDVLVNSWLPYQTMSCRLWGRTALYQSGGAFGFRDQLQDASSLVWIAPERTREQILLHAAHQFVEGDVLHWWHPPRSRGLRTRFADDLVWLPFLTADYVAATGDRAIFDELVPFMTAPALAAGEDEAFLRPEPTREHASVYEHCARALDRACTRGPHGLPLFGAGDWNDGMNRVGRGGKGESVWMAFFLDAAIGRFLPTCRERDDMARVESYEAYRQDVRKAVEGDAWDGEWYRRGYYDDGTPLGSRESDECKIDALVQAWSVLSGAAWPERAAEAMRAVERYLVSNEDGIVRLLTPPFDRTSHDPGYIKGYVRGVRENGGQYTHAAMWVVAAMARLGWNDRAAKVLEMLSPITRSATPDAVRRYQVEPYVVAADVYGEPPHVGRGGWTWYTGSSGWMYRVALESILGLKLVRGEALEILPCVPDEWPGFLVTWRRPGEDTFYEVRVRNPERSAGRVVAALLDGNPVDLAEGGARIPLARDGDRHIVEITLGPRAAGPEAP